MLEDHAKNQADSYLDAMYTVKNIVNYNDQNNYVVHAHGNKDLKMKNLKFIHVDELENKDDLCESLIEECQLNKSMHE